MDKIQSMLTLGTITITLLIASYSAVADVYIDLSQSDEISIANTEPTKDYTFKITESVSHSASITSISNHSKKHSTGHLPYHREVILAAQATSLEPALIHAVISVESKHNAHAKSNKGAYGLMQLMPATASRFNVNNAKDPQQNILAGSKYLRELLTLFNGDLKLSLAAYNAGPGAVQKYQNQIPPYKETLQYVPKVLKYYRQYS